MEEAAVQRIRAFLSQQLLVDFNGDVSADSDLFELGLMDSHGYIELIRFIELEFALKFTDDEILSNIMFSLSGITKLISTKRAGRV